MGFGTTTGHAGLPQYTTHTSTGETSNLLMLGRETQVPDPFTYHIPEPVYSVHKYA